MKFPNLPKWQLIAVPAMGIVLGVFYFGKYFVAEELIYANYKVEALEQDLQAALDQLAAEKSRSTIAERESDVVRRANNLLRATERKNQDKIASLQADLEFYRRLGGANGAQAPLSVHSVEIQPMQSPRVYLITISLTQNLRWASVIAGQVELGVDGIRNGVAEHLTNAQLLPESAEPLSFQFKHFELLESLITLPEGYVANRLTIRLKSDSLKMPVEQSMEWFSLLNQSTIITPLD